MTLRPLLGVDVGGTTIKSRLTDGEGRTIQEWRRPTPQRDHSGAHTVALLVDILSLARDLEPVAAMGVVVPGMVDDESGVCIRAVNLGWENLPLRSLLQDRVDVAVAFGHDVRAGALAEGVSGAASDHDGTFAFVPVGTGLASAVGAAGVIAPRREWAGEIGQVIIDRGDYAGMRVEQIASASGIARAADQPNAHAVAELVRAGDARATRVWNDAVDALGESIAWIVATAGADLIVVGGGLAEAGRLLLDPLGEVVARRAPRDVNVTLRQAAHGEAAAIVGALIMADRMLATS
ncbi:MAG TPA: ROK family protein [Galbitalea sp.]